MALLVGAGYGLALMGEADEKGALQAAEDAPAASAIFERDGSRFVATAGADGVARIYRDNVLIGSIRGHAAPIEHVAFVRNGEAVVTSDTKGVVQITTLDSLAAKQVLNLDSVQIALRDGLWEPIGKPVAAAWLQLLRFGSHDNSARGRARIVIVIDAGHGGMDPGATTAEGVFEKNVTLDEAKQLAQEVKKRGYSVILTRDNDSFITLKRRSEMADFSDADLFVSLHVDAAPNRNARGMSIYTLAESGLDKQAAALATRENQSDTVAGVDLAAARARIRSTMQTNLKQSSNFSETALSELAKVTELAQPPRRFAEFAVLKTAGVPAVLIQLGNVANQQDSAQVVNAQWRKVIAVAIASAIDSYFSKMPSLPAH